MATVMDVARYIVQKIGRTPSMKLERLTYYCQAWALAWDGVPLFEEDFEAWPNGPICPAFYNKHRGIFVIGTGFFDAMPEYGFSPDEVETMNTVIEYYGDKAPHWLDTLTRREDPWKLAREGVAPGTMSHRIITKESMQLYYGGLEDEQTYVG